MFGVHWVSVIVLLFPTWTISTRLHCKIFENFDDVFIICIEKFIDQLENKMYDQPLKNNYFKAWKVLLYK